MNRTTIMLLFVLLSLAVTAQKQLNINANKKSAITSVEAKANELTELSDKIWSFEEGALQEKRSPSVLVI